MTSTAVRTTAIPTEELPVQRKNRPVIGWALIGGAFLVVEGYALVAWFASGDAHRTPAGPTPIPGWMKACMLAFEVVGVAGFIGFLAWFVVRPLVREGHLTQDSLLCLVCWTLFWQDTLTNYLVPYTTYNSGFFNLGSWDNHILGWASPHGNLTVEPTIFVCTAYMWVVFGGVLIGTAVMRRARRRWPRLSDLELVGVTFVFFMIFDLIVEGSFMRLGFWTYPGAIRSLTLFPGHYYQFPVYESLMFGATWTGFSCLRFFRDDRGESFAERGADGLHSRQGFRTLLRFLALVGAANLIFVVTYDVPVNIFAVHQDAWPADVTSRSYLTDGLCGPQTTYACPGPTVPFAHGNSDHESPARTLVKGG